MKVLIIIIASRKEEHEADRVWQIKTWASENSNTVSVLWLRGWDERSFFLDGRDLYVPCKEDFDKILEKTIYGLKFALENNDFDILIRSNVSTYFDLNLLVKELSRSKYKEDFYGGYVDKSNGGYFEASRPIEYLSGTGIFMSRAYAELLSNLNSQDYLGIPDDVAISKFFDRNGLRRLRIKRNNLSSTHIFVPTFHIRAKSSTDAALAGKRMLLIDRYFSTRNTLLRLKIYLLIICMEVVAFKKHPESIKLYILRNRVVFSSYIRMKIEEFFG